MSEYAFPLCIQLAPFANFRGTDFLRILELLNEEHLYGVELNVTSAGISDPILLKETLTGYKLKMTMLATGAFAKENSLSLGSTDETLRKHSVSLLAEQLLPFAEEIGCGIICGFLKGGTDASLEQLKKSVREFNDLHGDTSTRIYLEATNHYESAVINTIEDGLSVVEGPWSVLPDTYHMNIEEASPSAALLSALGQTGNLHVSDNNRYFPGYGAIDFFQPLSLLHRASWKGTIAIEGRNYSSLEDDIRFTCAYLRSVSDRILLSR